MIEQAMRLDDLDEVFNIERSAYSHPWSRGIFQDCLKSGYDCRIYRNSERIIAYSICAYAAGEAHLLNLCVTPDQQGRGIGQTVLKHLLKRMEQWPVEMVFLEVRQSNQVAQHLYEKMGFNRIGQRKNYYPSQNGREDAWLYALSLHRTW